MCFILQTLNFTVFKTNKKPPQNPDYKTNLEILIHTFYRSHTHINFYSIAYEFLLFPIVSGRFCWLATIHQQAHSRLHAYCSSGSLTKSHEVTRSSEILISLCVVLEHLSSALTSNLM